MRGGSGGEEPTRDPSTWRSCRYSASPMASPAGTFRTLVSNRDPSRSHDYLSVPKHYMPYPRGKHRGLFRNALRQSGEITPSVRSVRERFTQFHPFGLKGRRNACPKDDVTPGQRLSILKPQAPDLALPASNRESPSRHDRSAPLLLRRVKWKLPGVAPHSVDRGRTVVRIARLRQLGDPGRHTLKSRKDA